jgi:hypothetical protein
MKVEVSTGLDELKKQFGSSSFNVREDGKGGAYVIMEPVNLGPRYRPETTWVGFHVPPQYPYADIYPVFIGAEVSRADKVQFAAPVTRGHTFEGRAAIQVSRRSGTAQNGLQKATAKVLKILDFLARMS